MNQTYNTRSDHALKRKYRSDQVKIAAREIQHSIATHYRTARMPSNPFIDDKAQQSDGEDAMSIDDEGVRDGKKIYLQQ